MNYATSSDFTPMPKTQVIEALVRCHATHTGADIDYCAGCPYCDEDVGTCSMLAPLLKDALYYITEPKDVTIYSNPDA